MITWLLQCRQHVLAEVAGAQQRCQHHNGEGHHDHLVETQQDGAPGDRQLHLEQLLPAGGAERLAHLVGDHRHLPQPEVGEAHGRR